jgi:hypothetical protein
MVPHRIPTKYSVVAFAGTAIAVNAVQTVAPADPDPGAIGCSGDNTPDWELIADNLSKTVWSSGCVSDRVIVKEVPQTPPPAPIITLTHVRADEMGADLFISFANHTPSGAMPAFVFGDSSSHDHGSSSSLV